MTNLPLPAETGPAEVPEALASEPWLRVVPPAGATVVLIYCRVSDDPKHKMRSVNQQETELRDWAADEDWHVGYVLKETDRSASAYAKREREQWKLVESILASGTVDILLIWESSRSTRDMEVGVALVKLCKAQGVKIGYQDRVYDLSDPDDEYRVLSDMLDSQREAGKTSKRVRRDVRRVARDGRPNGRIPYGYRRRYDPDTGDILKQVEHEVEGPVVTEIAARFVAGESARSIANDLNARGILPRPQKWRDDEAHQSVWTVSKIRVMLRNPAYAARRVHQGKVIGDAQWPALIDEETFARIEARLSDPARFTNRDRTDVRHLLTGIARCGVCLARLNVTKDGKGRPYYVCPGRHVGRSEVGLDAYITDMVVARLERDDIGEDEPGEVSAGLAIAQAKVAQLRAELEEAYQLQRAGKLSLVMLGRIEADLTPQIEVAEREERRQRVTVDLSDLAGPDAAQRWDAAGIERQRDVVRQLLTIAVNPTKRGNGPFRAADIDYEWRL